MKQEVIYKELGPDDLHPEKRTWYYDDFGNRLDKSTHLPVVIYKASVSSEEVKQTLLNEIYLNGPSYETE